MLHGRNARSDHHAVFTDQGHHIRHCAKADQIAVFPENPLLVPQYRRGNLKGHANSRQMGERILGIVSMGIHHRHRVGQVGFALMVVGDDQVNAQLPAELCFLHRSNAAVHRDNQADPLVL